jgi:hypothetical protein
VDGLAGPNWINEIKDGYRLMARRAPDRAALILFRGSGSDGSCGSVAPIVAMNVSLIAARHCSIFGTIEAGSTPPIAVKCQSFLDNVMLSSGAFEHGMIEAGDQRQSGAECSHILHRD